MIGRAIAIAVIGSLLTASAAFAFGGGGGIGIGAPMELLMPSPPTNVRATLNHGMASVSFAPPKTNGGSPVTSYTVEAHPGDIEALGATSPILVPGLRGGRSYDFTVKASNVVGTGLASAPSNCITMP